MLMMLNFKQSVRGAIRQPPNIITWIVTLERLQTCGAATDPQAVVQEWNQQCPKGQQLKGGQAQAVQLVLEKMPRAILAKVIEHVYTVSMDMMVDRMLFDWASRPEQLRRKVLRKEMEEHAEMAALVAYIYNKTMHTTPLMATDLLDNFCKPFVEGSDHHLSLELSTILADKPAEIQVEHISCIKALIIKHKGSHQQPGSSTVQLMQDLEADNYGILQASIEHDIKAVILHREKVRTWGSTAYWQKLEDGQKQWTDLTDGVRVYMKRYMKVVVADNSVNMLKAFMEYKRTITQKPHHRVSIESAAVLAHVNWLAPAGIRSLQKKCHEALMSALASDCPQSLILAMAPTHCNNASKLWISQRDSLNSLTNAGLDIDMEFSVLLKDRADKRDDRPGTINGRVCRAIGSPNPAHNGFWKTCKLLDERRTEPTSQLLVSDMVCHDEGDGFLPAADHGGSTTHSSVRGRGKFEQLGPDTCVSILDATFDGLKDAAGVGITFFVDVNVCCGDMVVAWIRKACNMQVPLYYFGTVADGAALEWVEGYAVESIAKSIKGGSLSMPGVKLIQVDDAASSTPKPLAPQLKLLVWDEDNQKAKIPEDF
ncbi:unnamed protein product [Prorocentrum cordatum]|uniref:Uncharacterized protein n=1 Tax=Prorocentrum cordatum TaxID=2364126 RepID=A0ABN9SGQ2_9DINO|nr:unnamed protein product [Polarella glacialis]